MYYVLVKHTGVTYVKNCLMDRILNIIINFNQQYCMLSLHMHIWTITTGSLHKDLSIFKIIQNCGENQNKNFISK